MRAAVVHDGVVQNIIVANPATDAPPQNCSLIEVPDGLTVSIGWTWDGGEFVSPVEDEPEGNI